jgi:hypothetical protein
MAKCRKCEADIRFAKTEQGKWMPYDSTPNPDGGLTLIGHDDSGVALVKVIDLFTPADAVRYMAHWATCSDPEFFRGKA